MNYTTNPQTSIDMVARLVKRMETNGLVMPPSQRVAYERLVKLCTGLTVMDIGCGAGIGTNILSTEAYAAWGVDVFPKSVSFANQMFGVRPNLRFDEMDICNLPPREFSKFNVVVMIDVLEHIEDYQTALDNVKTFLRPGGVVYVSTPNRNALPDASEHPHNPFHVREWTPGEFYDILTQNFEHVVFSTMDMERLLDLDTTETPILAKCEAPKKREVRT